MKYIYGIIYLKTSLRRCVNIKRLQRISFLLIILIIPTFLMSCGINDEPVEKETYMMGTIMNFKIYGKNAQVATALALKRISNIESKMSVNVKTSEISKLNSKAGKSGQKLSSDTYYVIEKSIEYSKLTGGALDATIEPIVSLWGMEQIRSDYLQKMKLTVN